MLNLWPEVQIHINSGSFSNRWLRIWSQPLKSQNGWFVWCKMFIFIEMAMISQNLVNLLPKILLIQQYFRLNDVKILWKLPFYSQINIKWGIWEKNEESLNWHSLNNQVDNMEITIGRISWFTVRRINWKIAWAFLTCWHTLCSYQLQRFW